MNKKLEMKIKKEIEGTSINTEPYYSKENDDGTITEIYSEVIEYKDKKYGYNINWRGIKDGEDGGEWSEPYNIQED